MRENECNWNGCSSSLSLIKSSEQPTYIQGKRKCEAKNNNNNSHNSKKIRRRKEPHRNVEEIKARKRIKKRARFCFKFEYINFFRLYFSIRMFHSLQSFKFLFLVKRCEFMQRFELFIRSIPVGHTLSKWKCETEHYILYCLFGFSFFLFFICCHSFHQSFYSICNCLSAPTSQPVVFSLYKHSWLLSATKILHSKM